MSNVELRGVTKYYGRVLAVEDVSLEIEEGVFFSLLGPSGCGKTTTLRMIAGFVQPTSGEILVDSHDVTQRPPEKRDMGMVFQNYAIFPHMSVYDNIAFGLKMRQVPKVETRERVTRALKQVGLSGYEDRYSRELSGGEQQRVALARVLVIEPKVLLLDEPLSALDKQLREEMQFWIKDLQRNLGITTVYVTHDQVEAMTVSDRIVVMNKGCVEQVGSPREVYERPLTRFVANFIGESNVFDGTVLETSGEAITVRIDGRQFTARSAQNPRSGQSATLLVRPEKINIFPVDVTSPPTGGNTLRGTVQDRVYRGANTRYTVSLSSGESVIVDSPLTGEHETLQPGDEVELTWESDNVSVLLD
jgi:putative spermidine/putrescine transport system ATP-binding protein